jgi:hypothetical protein
MEVSILKRVYKSSSFVLFVWLIRFLSRETSNFEMAKSVAGKKQYRDKAANGVFSTAIQNFSKRTCGLFIKFLLTVCEFHEAKFHVLL